MALRMFSRALITRRNAATSSTWVAVLASARSSAHACGTRWSSENPGSEAPVTCLPSASPPV